MNIKNEKTMELLKIKKSKYSKRVLINGRLNNKFIKIIKNHQGRDIHRFNLILAKSGFFDLIYTIRNKEIYYDKTRRNRI